MIPYNGLQDMATDGVLGMDELNQLDELQLDRMAQRIFAVYKSMPERGRNVDSNYIIDKFNYLKRLNRAQAYCECQSLDDENLSLVAEGFVKDGCDLDVKTVFIMLRNFWKLDCRC